MGTGYACFRLYMPIQDHPWHTAPFLLLLLFPWNVVMQFFSILRCNIVLLLPKNSLNCTSVILRYFIVLFHFCNSVCCLMRPKYCSQRPLIPLSEIDNTSNHCQNVKCECMRCKIEIIMNMPLITVNKWNGRLCFILKWLWQ